MRWYSILLLIFALLTVSACSDGTPAPTPTLPPPTPDPVSQLVSLTTPQTESDDGDAECEAMTATTDEPRQEAYEGILVGKTTRPEALEILGEPTTVNQYGNTTEVIYYAGSSNRPENRLSFYTKGGFVESLTIGYEGYDASGTANRTGLRTVAEILAEYGCPDVVLLRGYGEAPILDIYHGGTLVYMAPGVEFQFERIPLTVDNKVAYKTYFVPTTADLYLEAHFNSATMKALPWSEATAWRNP